MHLISLAQACAAAPIPGFLEVFRRGTLQVELYRPRGHDPQQPHMQDELFVVIAGSGTFRCTGQVQTFTSGDLLYAAAGAEHRFEAFSDDLEVWVVFYGPPGGERPENRTVLGQEWSDRSRRAALDRCWPPTARCISTLAWGRPGLRRTVSACGTA